MTDEPAPETPVVDEPVLCAACSEDLTPPVRDQCRRCAAPVGPNLDTSDGCVHCRTDRFALQKLIKLVPRKSWASNLAI